jgi:hypothetical protein
LNSTYPIKTPTFKFGLDLKLDEGMSNTGYMLRDSHPSEVKEGFSLIFHDPFEVVSKSSSSFQTLTNQTIVFWIIPTLLTYDESIVGYELHE